MRKIIIFSLLSAMAFSSELPFEFKYDGLTYNGVVQTPDDGEPKHMVVIIPGHGQTDFVKGKEYAELRTFFLMQGLAVSVWDKAGCGNSEGTYNHGQSIESSAAEAQAAIAELRHRKIPGSQSIGLWGISRAGWICPLIMEKDSSIAFWISVSGTERLANDRYMLEANLRAEGRSEPQISIIMKEWEFYQKALVFGGVTYAEFEKGIQMLWKDPYFNPNKIAVTEDIFRGTQGYFQNNGLQYDKATGQAIMLDRLPAILKNIQCPVLAILGEKDTQIDWQRTKSLYSQTIDSKRLTFKTFPNGNHTMHHAKTGAISEYTDDDVLVKDYYTSMATWLNQILK